jgi:Flp pilus assembly protein TadB
MNDKLASEKIVISAPTSFSGSAARIWKITATENTLLKWTMLVPIALCLIMCVWMLVAMWYIIIFGLFGIFVIPFRLLTRSGRNRKRNALQHRELIEAVRNNQKRELTDDEIVTVVLPTINNDK